MRPAILAALVLLVSGCLSTPDPAPPEDAGSAPPDWSERALASGHDHADPALHANLTTPNFRIVGRSPLVSEDYGTTVQGNLCGDANPTRDGRRLAVVETRGDVAFSLVDVTDAAAPAWLGELVMRRTYVYDLTVVPDGKHVVLVTSTHKGADRPGPLPVHLDGAGAEAAHDADGLFWRSPCAPGGADAWRRVRRSRVRRIPCRGPRASCS